ncbi:iron ABC transporter ATP-binding protein [Cryobacterium tagatosivorans]|uniref:Iron ABC transporter ATP-binding protein n=1 Tax=Cryobacterium tagatosivorans TaxID=1259199 RepID=A0A4R8UBW1_9MICO|nr:iron ABC transporter ATP-binding protein [Cryobacterium tagatosivorans]TFB48701.1 iron ABC transporter ATP-binding protein [Cryobacterium tagatosivorans]
MTLSPLPASIRARRVRSGSALATGALALIVLAGCAPGAAPTPSASSTAAPTTTPAASAEPTPTATEDPATAVTLGCDEVLTPDDVYAFNPNFGAAPGYKPAGGSAAAVAVSYQGVACSWLNQTSGDVIEISVAQPSASVLTDLKNQAVSASTPVPTYGTGVDVEGYFTASGGKGEAQVFTGKYWVVASSVEFGEPGDAEPLIAAAVSHLP